MNENKFIVVGSGMITEESVIDIKMITTSHGTTMRVLGYSKPESIRAMAEKNSLRLSLGGSIKEAISNKLMEVVHYPKRTYKGVPLTADKYGRFYFGMDGERFYISADGKMAEDEEGKIYVIEITEDKINCYGGTSSDPEFPYMFVSREQEDRYYDMLEEQGLENKNVFLDDFYKSDKVIQFPGSQGRH